MLFTLLGSLSYDVTNAQIHVSIQTDIIARNVYY